MDPDDVTAATCAVADLSARRAAEIALASSRLRNAERDLLRATARALASASPPPHAALEQRRRCRQQVCLFRKVLAGVPAD